VAYDTVKDFAPVALVGSNFLALVVNPDLPYKTTEELLAYAKANPGKVSFGTNGEGGFLHFATELFRIQGGFSYLHVPYKSVSAVMTEILGGQINATLTSFLPAQALISAGKVRLLGIATAKRLADQPNVPTLSEALPGFASGGWFGVIAPAGTPQAIINSLNRDINAALALPEVIQKMKLYGLEAHTESPEFFSETIRRDFSKWGKLISDIGFKPI
jgi:tripartite-type tricarboxylate transporter receptor subunit TctC